MVYPPARFCDLRSASKFTYWELFDRVRMRGEILLGWIHHEKGLQLNPKGVNRRDQLGSELERNVWIRAHPAAAPNVTLGCGANEGRSRGDQDIDFEARSANLTRLALCGGNESLPSLARGSARIDAMEEPHHFSEMFWRTSVSSLGGEYAEIGTCVEADHDVCDRVLSDARQKSFERLMERMQKVATSTSTSEDSD